jgi:hypothetical protein
MAVSQPQSTVGGEFTDTNSGSQNANFVPNDSFVSSGNNLGNYIRFVKQVVRDPASNNIEAIVYIIPETWQSEGAVFWTPEWSRLAYPQTRIYDPNTGIVLDSLPIQDFIYFQPPAGFQVPIRGNYQGKMYVPPVTDPAQFVADFWMPNVLSHLQSATLVNIQQVPIIAEEFKRQFGGAADANAYRLRYEYEQSGQIWEEDVTFGLLYSGSSGITSWYVNYAYANRAPIGELDRNQAVISTVLASRTTTPEWEANFRLVRQLFTQGIIQQMADTQALGETLARHRAESQALQAQVTAERQASQERIADVRRELLGGVDTYNDPVNGGLVQLPVGWSKYWVNERGEYLASDQLGFDPNTLNLGNWQQLQLSRSS